MVTKEVTVTTVYFWTNSKHSLSEVVLQPLCINNIIIIMITRRNVTRINYCCSFSSNIVLLMD